MLDAATDVREGEELDTERLTTWFAEYAPDLAGSIEVRQFPTGYSHLNYLLNIEGDEYVLRRPRAGHRSGLGHNLSQEWRVLSELQEHDDVHGPTPVAYCENVSILGTPFYVMERLEGVILRSNDPDLLGLTPPVMQELSQSCVSKLAAIHDVEIDSMSLETLECSDDFIEREIERWTKTYNASKTDDIQEMREIGEWLEAHQPVPSDRTLIHRDFRYDNLLLDPNNYTDIRAVLDWERATVGDPLMDVGTSLAHWFEPNDPDILLQLDLGPTVLAGSYTRREFVDRYAEITGRDCSNILFHYVYGLYRMAVVAQQYYARFCRGEVDDPRRAALIQTVRALAVTAKRAIDRESIDS